MKINFIMARSVVGFAIGDAVGVPYEFQKRGTFHCKDMRDSGITDSHLFLPAGSWSDDTSLMLCVLDSLRESGKENIYARWRKNAIQWFCFGKFTNHGYRIPYDIGVSCRRGISSMLLHTRNKKADNIQSNGNGGLMRILPLIFVPFSNNEELLDAIRLYNGCSHNHLISHICCLVYVLLGKNLLQGIPFKEALENAVDKIEAERHIPELDRIWTLKILSAVEEDIKSTGYVVDTLEAVIWSCNHSNSFEETVLRAVNLGGDTDTIAALSGGLSGIVYPEIPSMWVNKIRKLHVLQRTCNAIGIIKEKKFE